MCSVDSRRVVSFSSMPPRSLSESGLSQLPRYCVWSGADRAGAIQSRSHPALFLSAPTFFARQAPPQLQTPFSSKCETSLSVSSPLSTISTASVGAANTFFPSKWRQELCRKSFIRMEQQAQLAIKGAKPPSDQVQRGGATTHHTTNTEGKLVWNRV